MVEYKRNESMKKLSIIFCLCLLIANTLFAETWRTIKQRETEMQAISLNESDTELCTLAAATTYSDGILIFYCEAGISDREILNYVFDFVENELVNNYVDVVKLTSNIINDFRNNDILLAIKYETEPTDYTLTLPCIRTRLYCASYIEKAANDALKKRGIEPEPRQKKEIPYNRMNQIVSKYKTKISEQPKQKEEVPSPDSKESQSEMKKKNESQAEIAEKESSEINKPNSNRDYLNFSLLGGISLQMKPMIDLNIKILLNPYIFIVLQGGVTPVSSESLRISSMPMLPEGTIGFGGCIKPIKAYKMNIFGYAAAGFAYAKLSGGYIKDGKYTDFSFYQMLRACIGLDFPINSWFAISVQDCFDYLINLDFSNSVSAGLTLKL